MHFQTFIPFLDLGDSVKRLCWKSNIYIYTVTTFKYVEGGPDRKAPEVVWNTSSYI